MNTMALEAARKYLEAALQQEFCKTFSSRFDNVNKLELSPFIAVMRMLKIEYGETKPEVFRTLVAILHDFDPAAGHSHRIRTVKYIRTLLCKHPDLADFLISILPTTTESRQPSQTLHKVQSNQQGKIPEGQRTFIHLDPKKLKKDQAKFFNFTPPAVNAYVAARGIPQRIVSGTTIPSTSGTTQVQTSLMKAGELVRGLPVSADKQPSVTCSVIAGPSMAVHRYVIVNEPGGSLKKQGEILVQPVTVQSPASSGSSYFTPKTTKADTSTNARNTGEKASGESAAPTSTSVRAADPIDLSQSSVKDPSSEDIEVGKINISVDDAASPAADKIATDYANVENNRSFPYSQEVVLSGIGGQYKELLQNTQNVEANSLKRKYSTSPLVSLQQMVENSAMSNNSRPAKKLRVQICSPNKESPAAYQDSPLNLSTSRGSPQTSTTTDQQDLSSPAASVTATSPDSISSSDAMKKSKTSTETKQDSSSQGDNSSITSEEEPSLSTANDNSGELEIDLLGNSSSSEGGLSAHSSDVALSPSTSPVPSGSNTDQKSKNIRAKLRVVLCSKLKSKSK